MTKMATGSEATSVLRFTCPHVERVSYNTSISVPVASATYARLSVTACPSCAVSMAGQVLENLESTLNREVDRQVGLGMLGLANFLANTTLHMPSLVRL